MKTKTEAFVWEIGCEEIPASWLGGIIEELRVRLDRELQDLGLEPDAVASCGTLRRLVVHVEKLADRQQDRVEQVTGPPLKIARSDTGEWTQAALGFAKKNDVSPKELSVSTTEKGDYVGFERKIRGRRTLELLPEVMARTLRGLAFPKFMNWDATLGDGKGAFPFGRPIRWMVALFGGRVVPLQIEVVGSPPVVTGKRTRGHRFLSPKGARPGAPFAVSSFRELSTGLKKHYVLIDPEERRARLEKELSKLEKKAGAGRAKGLAPELVAELVEWPGAVLGSYPEAFLALPEEVRHTVLIHHQHYFPLVGTPSFIAVTNMASDRKGNMRRGAERVVVARLRDAKFFWEDDLKRPLEQRLSQLEGVAFHASLGSYRQKTERLVPLTLWIGERCGARETPLRRAATLAKCDLVTGMVGEFPELQGVMGGLYAREQGESEPVWKAVYAHYSPVGMDEDDPFPSSREGAVLSLADKMDTLASLFAVGVVPTGSRDPFGLRRAALGALRVLRESEVRLDFPLAVSPAELAREALRIVREQGVTVASGAEKNLSEFLTERLRFVFSRQYRYDEVNAVFALGALDRPVAELEKRIAAVATARGSADFEALSAAFKRVGNILSGQQPGAVDPKVFVEEEERVLHRALETARPLSEEHLAAGRYEETLRELARLRPAIDTFFDKVLVMAQDERVRANRLALLESLRSLFSGVADLSEIVPGEGGAKQAN